MNDYSLTIMMACIGHDTRRMIFDDHCDGTMIRSEPMFADYCDRIDGPRYKENG